MDSTTRRLSALFERLSQPSQPSSSAPARIDTSTTTSRGSDSEEMENLINQLSPVASGDSSAVSGGLEVPVSPRLSASPSATMIESLLARLGDNETLIASLTEENRQLKADNEDVKDQNDGLKTRNDALVLENHELRDASDASDIQMENLMAQLNIANDRASSMASTSRPDTSKSATSSKSAASSTDPTDPTDAKLRAQLADAIATVARQDAALADLQKQLDETKKAKGAAIAKNCVLMGQTRRAEERAALHTSQAELIAQLQHQLQQSRDMAVEMEKAKGALVERLEKLGKTGVLESIAMEKHGVKDGEDKGKDGKGKDGGKKRRGSIGSKVFKGKGSR